VLPCRELPYLIMCLLSLHDALPISTAKLFCLPVIINCVALITEPQPPTRLKCPNSPCRIRNVPGFRIVSIFSSELYYNRDEAILQAQQLMKASAYLIRSFIARSASSFICLRFISSRLSYFFLPLAMPRSTLHTPFLI